MDIYFYQNKETQTNGFIVDMFLFIFFYFQKGMMMEYELGKFLKERYVSKLINQTYLHGEVII